jgi:hypothetical protein
MTDQHIDPDPNYDNGTHPHQPAAPEPTFSEAPYSGNVRTRIHGYDWQLTIRSADSKSFVEKVDGLMKWLDTRTDKALNVEPPAPIIPGVTGATVPTAPATVVAGSQRAQCVMIEIGTSYTGGKPQLKFNCNGLEHPLTFTKDIGEMVKLLTPLGFTSAHIVIGQKYSVTCYVTYHENTKDGKTYKNVDKVEAA